ncbi:P-loop containing nucleoside triphosphate hydrolase protein [Lentinula guzmanii]|uniref:P-loop containing nucleoside triphosphate hydrolase protein n=1 Tax=Lentinula guzmanii TaxID=2804957 RepID=A0AA38MS75_9AGAR|nr:P-loop containing nucleoside triphosphate hydrolase protein [Lentinula guzmanii]
MDTHPTEKTLYLLEPSYVPVAATGRGQNIWSNIKSRLSQSNGAALLISFLSKSYFLQDSAKLFLLGSIIEAGRRLCQWFLIRFRIQYSITAEFVQGDPTYEWILHFLNDQEVWRRAREFEVSTKSSSRKWGITTGRTSEFVQYVPTYARPQIFRWNGHWLEITRAKPETHFGLFGQPVLGHPPGLSTMFVTVYTLDMSVMSAIVEEARKRYVEVSKPDVIIHMASNHHGGTWDRAKRQRRRPFNSIILQEGVLDSLLQDTKEFFKTESWYTERGIPHRRGYLLYGPPGSGKSSTICALAGELGMEMYSLSLASDYIDDSYFQRAAASMPKNSIFVIEDIDCVMPSWNDTGEDVPQMISRRPWEIPFSRSRVTLSTLLNVIDGVGSEEGRLFFTTTNHIDRLDPALIRPGRIDRKIPYYLATKEQAAALFMHFFPLNSISSANPHSDCPEVGTLNKSKETHEAQAIQLSKTFASQVPPHEFSIADLQGYLLRYKNEPERAAVEIRAWTEQEREYKRGERERVNKKIKEKEKKEAMPL